MIIFQDEPALAGYGSSEMISISADEIAASLGELLHAGHSKPAGARAPARGGAPGGASRWMTLSGERLAALPGAVK